MTKLHKTNNSIAFRKDNKIYVLVKTNNGLKIFNVKEDDVDWITVRGNHIPVKKGQSKEEAVKSFIDGKMGSGKGKYPFGEVDKVLYPGDKEKQKKNKQDFKKRQAESEKEDAEKFEKAKRREKKEIRKQEAPPFYGSIGWNNKIKEHFNYDKIPQNKKDDAQNIFKEYSKKYKDMWEEEMDKVQENLDKLSIEYGKKVAKLGNFYNKDAQTKTDRGGNPAYYLGQLGTETVFRSQYKGMKFTDSIKEKAQKVYEEYKEKYKDLYEKSMGIAHSNIDDLSKEYGEKIHKLESK